MEQINKICGLKEERMFKLSKRIAELVKEEADIVELANKLRLQSHTKADAFFMGCMYMNILAMQSVGKDVSELIEEALLEEEEEKNINYIM